MQRDFLKVLDEDVMEQAKESMQNRYDDYSVFRIVDNIP